MLLKEIAATELAAGIGVALAVAFAPMAAAHPIDSGGHLGHQHAGLFHRAHGGWAPTQPAPALRPAQPRPAPATMPAPAQPRPAPATMPAPTQYTPPQMTVAPAPQVAPAAPTPDPFAPMPKPAYIPATAIPTAPNQTTA